MKLMKLHFDLKRKAQAGFTLLEAMLSFSIAAFVLTGVYTLSIQSLGRKADSASLYERTAFARAILDEYIVTYPEMANSGSYHGHWNWRIIESEATPVLQSDFDAYFKFIKITAEVSDQANNQTRLSRIVARRGSL